MLRLAAVVLLVAALRAQTPAQETKDPLGRSTPQESVFQFLEACHARDYSKALHYLDLRHMSPAHELLYAPKNSLIFPHWPVSNKA
jgi:hypothetical protein